MRVRDTRGVGAQRAGPLVRPEGTGQAPADIAHGVAPGGPGALAHRHVEPRDADGRAAAIDACDGVPVFNPAAPSSNVFARSTCPTGGADAVGHDAAVGQIVACLALDGARQALAVLGRQALSCRIGRLGHTCVTIQAFIRWLAIVQSQICDAAVRLCKAGSAGLVFCHHEKSLSAVPRTVVRPSLEKHRVDPVRVGGKAVRARFAVGEREPARCVLSVGAHRAASPVPAITHVALDRAIGGGRRGAPPARNLPVGRGSVDAIFAGRLTWLVLIETSCALGARELGGEWVS